MATNSERGVRAGLALLGLLSAFDILSLFGPTGSETEPGPPFEILVAGVLLGVASLVLVVLLWRGARGAAPWVLVALRVVSALLATPAFFVEGVPVGFVVLAAVFILLTVIGIVLIRPALRRSPSPA